MQRIVVVGSTSSGKTTLAATLASRLDLRHVELDALHWDAGWLDYRLPLLVWRLARRTLVRVYRCEDLWNGNREDARTQLFSRDSLFLWLVTSYGRHRREYPRLLGRPEWAHIEVHRFRTPRKAEEWLDFSTGV